MSWSVGTLLYAGIAVLVTLRFIHHGVTPEQFDAPYWVAMGALAISVVAGAAIADMPSTPMIDASRSLVSATVVVFWCFAAWLIPMFAGAGIWRHVVHRVPLRYTPARCGRWCSRWGCSQSHRSAWVASITSPRSRPWAPLSWASPWSRGWLWLWDSSSAACAGCGRADSEAPAR